MCNRTSRLGILQLAPLTCFKNISVDYNSQGHRENHCTLLSSLMLVLFAISACTAPSAVAQAVHFSGVQSIVATGMNGPQEVAVDAAGNLYIADTANNQVLKVPYSGAAYGTATTVGNGLSAPQGVAVDAAGNVYIADTNNNQVLKETLSAGTYSQSVVLDSTLNSPQRVAVDESGNVYISDTYNNRVLKVSCSGPICNNSTVVADSGLDNPVGVAVDGTGNVYIADWGNSRWLMESWNGSTYSQGYSTTLASAPTDVAVDGLGNVYIADYSSRKVLIFPWNSGESNYGAEIPIGANMIHPISVAVDGNGNVYIADTTYGWIFKETLSGGGDFGRINVASPGSTPISLVFTFDSAGAIGAPQVLTQGAPLLDFIDATSGSCTTNGSSRSYSIGDACTVDVKFTPTFAATRYGAAELMDGSANVLATGYVFGTGVGPQVAFLPGSQTTVSTTTALISPVGVAVDGNGSIYIADQSRTQILMEPVSGNEVTLGSGLFQPGGVAIDGAGNVYFTDSGHSQVLRATWNGSSFATPAAVGSGWSVPNGVAVDGSGNLYITDTGNSNVLKETWNGASWVPTTVVSDVTSLAVAVDGNGNVYVTDGLHSQVLMESWNGTSYIANAHSPVGSGLWSPQGVAADGNGNVFISDTNNNRVLEETWNGTSWTQTQLASPSTPAPAGIAVDAGGNVYVTSANPLTTQSSILKIDSADAPTLTFATPTPAFSTDTDSPQSVIVENVGNATLTAVTPGLNVPADFSQVDGSGTPADCTTSFSLAADSSCNLSIQFAPVTASSSLSESLTLTDNALNAVSATQGITLKGTGTAPAILIAPGTTTLSDGTVGTPYTQTFTASAGASPYTYAPTGSLPDGSSLSTAGVLSGTPTRVDTYLFTIIATDKNSYTGSQSYSVIVDKGSQTIAFTVASPLTYGIAPVSLSAMGGASSSLVTFSLISGPATLSGSTLTMTGVGTIVVAADQAGDSNYSAASQVRQIITVNQATPVVNWNAPSAIVYGTGLSAAQLNASSSAAGTFTYSPLAGTVLSAGSNQLSVTFAPTDTTDYSTATATVSLTVNKAALAVTPTAASRPYGTANPTFAGSVAGLLAGDAITATYASNASMTTVVGVYSTGANAITSNLADPGGKLGNYAFTQNLGALTITQATTILTWGTQVSIPYGTALGGTQLTADSGGVAGSFAYTPSAGAVLTAGPQTLSVTFIPTDAADYATATASTTIMVNKATPVVIWTAPAAIAHGTGLSATQLNATSSAAGTFTYSPVAGVVLGAGSQTLLVTFAPTDATDYATSTAPTTVTITVNKATASATPNAATKAYGATDPALSGTLIGFALGDNVTASYSRVAGETVAGGPYSISATFSPSVLANYNITYNTANFTIAKAASVATWPAPTAIIYGTALSVAQLNATSGGVAGTFVYAPAAGAVLGAGSSQTLSASFAPTDSSDYNTSTVGTAITVSKATAFALVTSSANPVLVMNGVTLTARVSLASYMPSGTVIFLDGITPLGSSTLTNGTAMLAMSNLSAGSHTITVSYSGDGNFVATTSGALTQMVADFALVSTSGSNGDSVTVQPGGTATILLTFTPTNATTWPATVTLSASGLPVGDTVTFSPQTLAAGSSTAAVTMTVQVAQTSAALLPAGAVGHHLTLALALLVLPFGAGVRRARKNIRRMISLCLLLAVGTVTIAGLSGCGTATNPALQNPLSYTVTVTATSGTLSHTTTVVITVE